MAEMYTYQVARVRAKELKLLNHQDIDQLMAAKTYQDCLRVLMDKGWGTGSENTAEDILSAENKKTWDFIGELIDDTSPFDVLFYPTDFNNLKAAIKIKATSASPDGHFKSGGTVDTALMVKALDENDFSLLPDFMSETAEKAYKTLLQTRDGQLCDIIIDRACLEAVADAGRKSDNDLVKKYAQLSVAVADIKIAVRCQKTGKSPSFINDALAPCDTLDVSALASAAAKSLDDIFTYLSNTEYSEASEKLKESFSAFEKWCDNVIMDMIKGQKSNPFTIGPIIAYILARQNEIRCVRIILSGKLNGIDNSIIRERLRDMYV